jgi:hypothetical protein
LDCAQCHNTADHSVMLEGRRKVRLRYGIGTLKW